MAGTGGHWRTTGTGGLLAGTGGLSRGRVQWRWQACVSDYGLAMAMAVVTGLRRACDDDNRVDSGSDVDAMATADTISNSRRLTNRAYDVRKRADFCPFSDVMIL